MRRRSDTGSEGGPGDPVPRLLFRGYVELTAARLHKVMFNSGILEVESDLIAGARAKVFFQRHALYLNKARAKTGPRLCDLLRNRLTEPCCCVARPFVQKNGTFKRISGVEVHLIAKRVWVGERSSPSAVSKRGPQTARLRVSSNDGQDLARSTDGQDLARSNDGQDLARSNDGQDLARSTDGQDLARSNDGQEAGPAAAAETSGVLRGEISRVAGSVGTLKKVDGCCRKFFAHQCFLHGVCLRGVRLEDVLHEGKMVSYKLSNDGCRVISVMIGSNDCMKTLDPEDLSYVLQAWCHSNCISQETMNILLCLAGWISDDLNPTVDQKDYKEVVDADSLPGP